MPKSTAKRASAKESRYQPHPMLDMEKGIKAKVEEETGKPWSHWVGVARKMGVASQRDLGRRLQAEHGFASRNASWLAWEATNGSEYDDPSTLVDELYGGARASLRPVHEAVLDEVERLGDDVRITACKTMVPVYRKHVFAELRPVADGVEVELALGDAPAKGRLQKADRRMPGDRVTHRVVVGSKKDVDGELRGWLEKAYENGAGRIARSTEFEMPADFSKAMKASKPAGATWESMTPAMRRDMVQWITSAKQDETRARRLSISIDKLASGKKRTY